jgi:hypothetical protein
MRTLRTVTALALLNSKHAADRKQGLALAKAIVANGKDAAQRKYLIAFAKVIVASSKSSADRNLMQQIITAAR